MAYLKKTKKAKLGGREVKGFPLVFDEEPSSKLKCQVNWLALSYFLDVFRQGASVSSIETYAAHLVDFISQLEVDGIRVEEINDAWLKAYKDEIRARRGSGRGCNTDGYASQVISSVLNYIKWLQDAGYIRGIIGEGRGSGIRVRFTKNGIKHALNKRGTRSRRVVTPRDNWIDIVKGYAPFESYDLVARFELMIDWGRVLGLRAMETCELLVDQLPSRKSAERAIKDKKQLDIKLTITKGRKDAVIKVSPVLVKKTWDYIDCERENVVSELRKRAWRRGYEVYKDSGHIFLSSETGGGLNPRSYANSIRKAFLLAVEDGALTIDERVWPHGLRHNFVANLLRAFDSAGVKRPEDVAMQATRHGSKEAMEPYLTDRFNADFDG